MPMHEGDQFVDFKAFKAAMQNWSVAGAHKINFRYKKLDSWRKIVACAHDDCPFRVRATYIPTRQCVVVASVGGEHNCIGAGQIGYSPSSQQTWLRHILPTALVVSTVRGQSRTQAIRDWPGKTGPVAGSVDGLAAFRASRGPRPHG